MSSFDVQRATAIICRAQEAKWVGEGEMPESDNDRILKAEEIVQAARQVKQFRDGWMGSLGDNEMLLNEKVPTWRDAEGHGADEILMEADLFVGANERTNGSSSEAKKAEPALEDYEGPKVHCACAEQMGRGPMVLASECERCPQPQGGDADEQSVVRDAEPHVTEPQAVAASGAVETPVSTDPQAGEVWLDAQGTKWQVSSSYKGGPMIEVMKVSTGEPTVGPAGMLKTRVSEEAQEEPTSVIDRFDGEWYFLSNFSPSPIEFEGIIYPTAEHLFQALKSDDPETRRVIARQSTPSAAKKAGRSLDLRPDWEDVKVEAMRFCLELKFASGTDLARRLLETGDARLIEGNTWGDHFWGQVDGEGENWLGWLLEERRQSLRDGQMTAPETDITQDEQEESDAVPDHPLVDADVQSMPQVPISSPRQQASQSSPIIDHDADDDEVYEKILARVEERYTPSGFPLPHELEDVPQFVPDNLDEYQEVQVQRMHSQYNALAALAKLRHDYEDAISRECQAALKLASQEPMRRAREELGKSSAVADRQAWAEEQSEEVTLWRARVDRHAAEARAYQTFFDIYTKNVAVTSRDLEFRLRQLNT